MHTMLTRIDTLGVACLLIYLISLSTCCFITNCPPGGKRSIDEPHIKRKCTPCGFGGLGRCVGPHICCGKYIGCLINTKETHICQRENLIPVMCNIGGKLCGKSGKGHCVSQGVCCTEEQCMIDSSCTSDNEDPSEDFQDIMQNLLKRSSGYDPDKRELIR